MNINSYFDDFLAEIRLTQTQKNDLKKGHKTLRDRLQGDPELSKYIIATFLQGSYRRATAIRPLGEKRADVDVIVVTNIDKDNVTPEEVIDLFIPFMEKYYKGKYRIQGRSIGIELSYVDLDIVITSAPSEVEAKEVYQSRSVQSELMLEDYTTRYPWRLVKNYFDPAVDQFGRAIGELNKTAKDTPEWKTAPLWIPDRDAAQWVETHPLEQIRWTNEKNAATGGHYVNVVKAIKWFRLEKLTDIKHPKGYPLEHMVGDCCPSNIASVAEGVVRVFENIVNNYRFDRALSSVPVLPDRGVPNHNVWKRISKDDFIKFYDHIKDYAAIARQAYDADTIEEKVKLWKSIFGDKFPDPPQGSDSKSGASGSSSGGFTPRTAPTAIGGGRFG
ncbi:nucleotidyltransferase [Chitinophaga oryzae]|uniref:Nucleotidyltransferase n=1 Tax=Chitinophaga oryzae TaxID=2725414 RepID=A0ABX6LRF0_9BACT|nr:nucleotidyltransferase [Chitinophaga oryzae]QJB42444.1 nucleotidyltransferase [Chitinophaga oryzae]